VSTLAFWVAVGAQKCVFDVGDHHFDFTALANKEITYDGGEYNYTFTFCGQSMCHDKPSSLCQRSARTDMYSCGLWTDEIKWTAKSGILSGPMYGDLYWCENPRVTNVTFQCGGEGSPKFLDMKETANCVFNAVIQVPFSVCFTEPPCCTSTTYTLIRMQRDGSTAVAQADAAGNWYDEHLNRKSDSMSVLCLKDYGRCFVFDATQCTGTGYNEPPSQCYGESLDWSFVQEAPLADNFPVKQSVWVSPTEGYVVTLPLGGSGQCIVVSGSNVDSSFNFGLTPNATLWEIPKKCVVNGVLVNITQKLKIGR